MRTSTAVRLYVDTWRWEGVPFLIRAGKSLPVTCTEALVRLRRPPTVYPGVPLTQNHLRLRISPDVAIGMGMMVLAPGEEGAVQSTEMVASRHPKAAEMDAYERVLGDAMHGDATHFAREDYVEEAWRIVDPILKAGTQVHDYEPGTWGPSEILGPEGGWDDPVVKSGHG